MEGRREEVREKGHRGWLAAPDLFMRGKQLCPPTPPHTHGELGRCVCVSEVYVHREKSVQGPDPKSLHNPSLPSQPEKEWQVCRRGTGCY